MNRKQILMLLLPLALFSGEVISDTRSELEPLYGVSFVQHRVIIEVKSTGCSRARHFSLRFSRDEDKNYPVLGIIRNKPDRCRAKPRPIKLTLALPVMDGYDDVRLILENRFYSGIAKKQINIKP